MSRQAHFKERLDGRIRELKPLEVGVQVPHSIYTEVPQESAAREPAEAFGRGVPQAGRAEGVPDRGGPSTRRPCPHDDLDTAEIRGVAVVGFIKGKSAIHLARVYGERKQNYVGQSFWARGFFVSTVGRDERTIREYIRNQEKEDERLDQMNLWK